jgi:hypothetical protein
MKKTALITAFMICMFGAITAGAQDTKPKDGKVICCHDGKCDTEHTLAECAKLKGKVVKDCKECK